MPRKAVRGERRLSSLNMKTTESLRAHLENEAARSGRTLTHEVEYRLERSFTEDGTYTTATNAAILRDIAGVFQLIGFEKEESDNSFARDTLRAVIDFIVSAHLSDRPQSNGLLSQLLAQDAPAPKSKPITKDDQMTIRKTCLEIASAVVGSSNLPTLPAVVRRSSTPFGFHSDKATASGIMALVAGKPEPLAKIGSTKEKKS